MVVLTFVQIVMDDADIDLAVDGALWGAFGTTGQRCTATSRLICHEKVYKERLRLVDEYKKCVKQPATTSKRWRLVISISRRLKPLSDQVKDLFKWPTPCPGSLFSLALRFFGKVKTDIPSLC